MKNNNIILFSSGISEKNGSLMKVKDALEVLGYKCAYWRDLFKQANDPSNIALLPSLIKKIPTFDYAVLICEGHDKTIMLRDGEKIEYDSMRDNVLFEIGLCSMALGVSRTILITDSHVHLPEDLSGKNGSLAVKRIIYENECDAETAAKAIDEYILQNGDVLTPVVIGAASSSAEGYVNNFLLRTLEHIEDGVFIGEEEYHFELEKVYIHLKLPNMIGEDTAKVAAIKLADYDKAIVPTARSRSAVFRCQIVKDELHIFDFPTSIITSYNVAKMILDIDADDSMDMDAAARFAAKELKLFEATLKSLLAENYVTQIIDCNYRNLSKEEKMKMVRRICELFKKRLSIEYGV